MCDVENKKMIRTKIDTAVSKTWSYMTHGSNKTRKLKGTKVTSTGHKTHHLTRHWRRQQISYSSLGSFRIEWYLKKFCPAHNFLNFSLMVHVLWPIVRQHYTLVPSYLNHALVYEVKNLQMQLSASCYQGIPFKFFLGSRCAEINNVLTGHIPCT